MFAFLKLPSPFLVSLPLLQPIGSRDWWDELWFQRGRSWHNSMQWGWKDRCCESAGLLPLLFIKVTIILHRGVLKLHAAQTSASWALTFTAPQRCTNHRQRPTHVSGKCLEHVGKFLWSHLVIFCTSCVTRPANKRKQRVVTAARTTGST